MNEDLSCPPSPTDSDCSSTVVGDDEKQWELVAAARVARLSTSSSITNINGRPFSPSGRRLDGDDDDRGLFIAGQFYSYEVSRPWEWAGS